MSKIIRHHRQIIKKYRLCWLLVFVTLCYCLVSFNTVVESSVKYTDKYDFVHGISLVGKLKYDKNFTNLNYVNIEAKKGGKIRLSSIGSFNNFNAFILQGISPSGINLIYDSLLFKVDDEPSSYYGLLAEGIFVDKNYKYVVFKLNKKATWHDGSLVTTQDVKFTFDILHKKGKPNYKILLSSIKKITVINENVIRIDFASSSHELPVILGTIPILQKKYYNKIKFAKIAKIPPMSSGPYQVDMQNTKIGKNITYSRVRSYWGKDLPINRGRYNFDEISFIYYQDAKVALKAFFAGEYDFRQENIASHWKRQYTSDLMKRNNLMKQEITHKLPLPLQGFAFNLRKEKFVDRKIRKAIALVYDFNWANKNLFFNHYTRADSYFPNSIYDSNQYFSNLEKTKLKQVLSSTNTKNYTSYIKEQKSYNDLLQQNMRNRMLQARELLLNSDRVFYRKGKLIDKNTNQPFVMEFLLYSKAFEKVILPYMKNLSRIGITAKIKIVDTSVYQDKLNRFDYDIIVVVLSNDVIPGNEQYLRWNSKSADIEGSSNYVGVKNKNIDMIVEKINNVKDVKEITSWVRVLDKILLYNHYVVPHWYINKYRIAYSKDFMMSNIIPKYGLSVLDSWWYSK